LCGDVQTTSRVSELVIEHLDATRRTHLRLGIRPEPIPPTRPGSFLLPGEIMRTCLERSGESVAGCSTPSREIIRLPELPRPGA
jgi:hypothetical protein